MPFRDARRLASVTYSGSSDLLHGRTLNTRVDVADAIVADLDSELGAHRAAFAT